MNTALQLFSAIDLSQDVIQRQFIELIEEMKAKNQSLSGSVRMNSLFTILVENFLPNHLSYVLQSGLQFNVDELGSNGFVALHCAVTRGCEKSLSLLLAAGADANQQSDGQPFLHLICQSNHNDQCAQLLLDHGAEPNSVDLLHRSPLHVVQRVSTAKLLIKAGININARDRSGETPLLSILNRLSQTQQRGVFVDIALALIRAGADVYAVDNDGKGVIYRISQIAAYIENDERFFIRLHLLASLVSAGWSFIDWNERIGKDRLCLGDFCDVQLIRLLLVAGVKVEKQDVVRMLHNGRSHSRILLPVFRRACLRAMVADQPATKDFIKKNEIRKVICEKEAIEEEEKEMEKVKEQWCDVLWQYCMNRVVDIAVVFARRLPTLILVEICLFDQPWLRDVKVHHVWELIRRITSGRLRNLPNES